jgi:hypothetical protein
MGKEYYLEAKNKTFKGIQSEKVALSEIEGLFSLGDLGMTQKPFFLKLETDIKETGLMMPLSCIRMPKDWETNLDCNPGLGNDADLKKRHAGVVLVVLNSKIEKGLVKTNQKQIQFNDDDHCLMLYTGHQRYRILERLGATHTDVIISEWEDLGDILDIEKAMFREGGGKRFRPKEN